MGEALTPPIAAGSLAQEPIEPPATDSRSVDLQLSPALLQVPVERTAAPDGSASTTAATTSSPASLVSGRTDAWPLGLGVEAFALLTAGAAAALASGAVALKRLLRAGPGPATGPKPAPPQDAGPAPEPVPWSPSAQDFDISRFAPGGPAVGGERVLLLGLDSSLLLEVLAPLAAAGLNCKLGTVADLASGGWSLVVGTPALAGNAGIELLAGLANPAAGGPSLVLVGTAQQLKLGGPALRLPAGVAQVQVPCPADAFVEQILQVLRARLTPPLPDAARHGPPVPTMALPDESGFGRAVQDELEAQRAGTTPGDSFVVSVQLEEFNRYRDRLTSQSQQALWQEVAQQAQMDAVAGEAMATGSTGDFLLLLPGLTVREASQRLQALSARLANTHFDLGGQFVQFSPAIGYAGIRRAGGSETALAQAREAARSSAIHLDLQPAMYRPGKPPAAAVQREPSAVTAWWQAWRNRHVLLVQYAITSFLGLVLPFLAYWGLAELGLDVSGAVYIIVVVALALTALSIWAEGLLAMRREDPPEQPAQPYPPASAVIAAYLPNEAPIIEDTVRAFLRVQYPGALQVILAYNTPKDMPEVEQRLRDLAREHPNFIPMRVMTSTSKAQNVNAALAYVTGEFTAVFDADHQPDAESFRRAWRWISHGADVVQGHCFISNGDASWVARMVAIEFEQIYAVSHPGRARLHGFGIFGGSNGYWRSGLLRELRMHGFMLTEDIDSSMRAVVRGRRIVSDPYLVSRELAPETMQALTKQRLRWAQGWLQISLKWVMPALRSRQLSIRQKIGMMQLLAWREAYPWVSMQILPLIAFWAVQAGSLSKIDWFVPLFVVTSLFTLSTGPGQIYFTWKLADPQLKKHPSWFWFYVLTSTLFYSGLKNAWNRIAHLKEVKGETTWVVTTRAKAKK